MPAFKTFPSPLYHTSSFYDFLSILNFAALFDRKRGEEEEEKAARLGSLRRKWFSSRVRCQFLYVLRHIQLKQSPIDETKRNQMTKKKRTPNACE